MFRRSPSGFDFVVSCLSAFVLAVALFLPLFSEVKSEMDCGFMLVLFVMLSYSYSFGCCSYLACASVPSAVIASAAAVVVRGPCAFTAYLACASLRSCAFLWRSHPSLLILSVSLPFGYSFRGFCMYFAVWVGYSLSPTLRQCSRLRVALSLLFRLRFRGFRLCSESVLWGFPRCSVLYFISTGRTFGPALSLKSPHKG